RKFGVQIDEEVETNLVGCDSSQGVEVLMDIHQLLGLDVQPALLEELSREAGREGLSEFKMSPGERKGRAVGAGGFLDEDRFAVDEDSASPYEGFRASGKSCTSTIIPTRFSTF